MATYRAALIGVGWMGLLYDLAQRMGVWHVDDIDRPTPTLNIHRQFHYHEQHLPRARPTSYAVALQDRPDLELVAAAERAPRVAITSAPPANAVSAADPIKVSARPVSSKPNETSAGAIIATEKDESAQPSIDRT